jgi:hypothetical protein
MLNEEKNNIKDAFLNNKKNLIIIFVSLVVIISMVGFYLFKINKPKVNSPKEPVSQENQEALIPEVIYNLNGNVKSISENVIIFEADNYETGKSGSATDERDENNQPVKSKKIIQVQTDANTEFTYLNFVIHKETGKKIPQLVKMNLEDFKIGDYVEVMSDQNIKDKETFLASKVRLISRQK